MNQVVKHFDDVIDYSANSTSTGENIFYPSFTIYDYAPVMKKLDRIILGMNGLCILLALVIILSVLNRTKK